MVDARISGRNCGPLASEGCGLEVLRAKRPQSQLDGSTLDVDAADKKVRPKGAIETHLICNRRGVLTVNPDSSIGREISSKFSR